jgi:hypothetical protein
MSIEPNLEYKDINKNKYRNENTNDEEPVTVFLVYDEPNDSIVNKWLSWIIVMAVFLIILIYVTNYFAEKKERFKINPSPHMHYRNQQNN